MRQSCAAFSAKKRRKEGQRRHHHVQGCGTRGVANCLSARVVRRAEEADERRRKHRGRERYVYVARSASNQTRVLDLLRSFLYTHLLNVLFQRLSRRAKRRNKSPLSNATTRCQKLQQSCRVFSLRKDHRVVDASSSIAREDLFLGEQKDNNFWVQKLTFFLPFKTAEMSKWRTLTFLAIPACCAFGVYSFANAEHGHGEEQPAYSYLKRRSREQWPWGGDLGLFEYPKGDH